MFIDIHSHNQTTGNSLSITSIRLSDKAVQTTHTVGIYPFDVGIYTEQSFEQLRSVAQESSVFGIGEIGLDYRPQYRDTAARQRELFERQVEIANQIAKPIVVHQVRAMEDTLTILARATVPVIMHGFSGSQQSATRLTDRGYYLSFGHLLLNNTRLQSVLRATPLDRLFLETDDNPSCTIEQMYCTAAEIVGTTIENLEQQIEQNYRLCQVG